MNPNRRNNLYFLSLTPGLLVLTGNVLGGYWAGFNIVFSMLLLPLIELASGRNTDNRFTNNKIPDFILMLQVLLHAIILFTLGLGILNGTLSGGFQYLAIVSTGIVSGSSAIIVAHELIHKNNKVKRNLGKALLLACGNFYFYTHHLCLHHKNVATAEDAATAKRFEPLLFFVPRSIIMQIAQSVALEMKLASKRSMGFFNFKNNLLYSFLWVLAIIGVLYMLAPSLALAYLLIILYSNVLLEYVNYIEHYGLTRESNEKVSKAHSWNCDYTVSRFLLFDLSRHTDHHLHASKPYHTLLTYEESPTLPGGYTSLIIPAIIYPWWKYLTEKALSKHYASQK